MKQVNGVITWIKSFLDDDYQSKLVSGTNIKTINNESLLGSGDIDVRQNVFFGFCSTSASTQNKVVECRGGDWVFSMGNILFVEFTNGNSYNGTARLSIDGTVKDVATVGTTKTSRYYWKSGEVVGFIYDGDNMVLLEGGNATTTYYGITKLSNSTSSTSETLSATPKAVKTAYDLANGKADEIHTHTVSDVTDFPSIPSKTSDLTNDGEDGTNVFVSDDDSRLSDARTPTAHTHDDRYYTETETDTLLSGKAQSVHSHTTSQITDLSVPSNTSDLTNDGSDGSDTYVESGDLSTVATTGDYSDLDNIPSTFTPSTHNHDDRYYTETEMDTALNGKQATLVSGTNIKTINNQSILGNGNISVGGGGGLTIDDIYPVGSIYMTVDSTKNPNNLFSGTTWVKIDGAFLMASGRVPIEPNVEFEFTNGQTGGEVIHSLTESEMPRHTHIQNAHNHTQVAHHHTFPHYQSNGSTTTYSASWGNQKTATANTSDSTPTINDETATNRYTGGNSTGDPQSASNGVAHNNMPPYLVVDMWKRTA